MTILAIILAFALIGAAYVIHQERKAKMTWRFPITCRETGETFTHETTYDADGRGIEFHWTDGNYGCDCNRSLFWHRAKGIEEPEAPECGDGVLYHVPYGEREDGYRITIDPPAVAKSPASR